jgi:hypothetical protein
LVTESQYLIWCLNFRSQNCSIKSTHRGHQSFYVEILSIQQKITGRSHPNLLPLLSNEDITSSSLERGSQTSRYNLSNGLSSEFFQGLIGTSAARQATLNLLNLDFPAVELSELDLDFSEA